MQDYRRAQDIAAGLVTLATPSPELSKSVVDELNMLLVGSSKTTLRVITRSAIQSLNEGSSFPRSADEKAKGVSPLFIVAADESQRMRGEKLAQSLKENGIDAQGIDVISSAKDAKINLAEDLEIHFLKGENKGSFLSGLAEKVKRFTGEEPKLVEVSTDHDPGTYEIWLSRP